MITIQLSNFNQTLKILDLKTKQPQPSKKNSVDKFNRELSGLAQKLSSLWPWEPVQTLLIKKRLLEFSFETIFPLEDFGEERRREHICRQIERRKRREEEEEEEEKEEEEHDDDGDDLGFGAGNDLILQGPEGLISA
jgi:hypothetical protein